MAGVRQICGGGLTGSPRFPEVFPSVAEVQAAQGDNGIGSPHRPAHARLFEPLTDDDLATGFHHSRADKEALPSEACVAHAVGIGLEVVNSLLDGRLPVRLSRL